MISYGVIVHGGAGSDERLAGGCQAACEEAFKLLEAGGSALDAAVRGARALEDDGRFNAGRGSALRLDGKTIEMDAAVMDSGGDLGLVIAIRGIKNPVLAARAVMDTPHMALAGEGARVFALKQGLPPFDKPSREALKRHERLMELMKEGRLGEANPLWRGRDAISLWNFDTIGVVALDKEGRLAVAVSTGGASPMMQGRVGDTPMVGCGFYAGPSCAVAATGIGEEIIRKMLSKTVYDMVSSGMDLKAACEKGVALFPPEIAAGVIAISPAGYASASNTGMASHARTAQQP